MSINEGISPGPPPTKSAPKNVEPDVPSRHPTPRSPFPLTAVLVVVIGILFLLLVFSVGFNVWFLMRREQDFRRNGEKARAEEAARVARVQGEQVQLLRQNARERGCFATSGR